ncbi:15625_t:CDS:1 [Funneliformis caledonium]|uniref:15625_t:CDS:1 n=1 Tax=Funneliformis caledonium TaxID=1117310 RepID=A0A9N9AK23_9GLOM|nr:15625_t:CDS:1 [Funneliformis caledonium]
MVESSQPSNSDICHVKDELKKILIYFKKCENNLSDNHLIRAKINEINEQGLEFHSCLQKSITQSITLEKHAENMIECIEILGSSNFSPDCVSEILRTHLDDTQTNREETRQIKDKYNNIKGRLIEINNEISARSITNMQLLLENEEELKDLERSNGKLVTMGIILMFVLVFGKLNINNKDDALIFLGIMVVTVGIYFLNINRDKKKIRKLEREIKEIRDFEEALTKGINVEQIFRGINPLVFQMGHYNVYWDTQYNRLNILLQERTESQAIQLALSKANARWEKIMVECDNYTKTVRKLVKESRETENS